MPKYLVKITYKNVQQYVVEALDKEDAEDKALFSDDGKVLYREYEINDIHEIDKGKD